VGHGRQSKIVVADSGAPKAPDEQNRALTAPDPFFWLNNAIFTPKTSKKAKNYRKKIGIRQFFFGKWPVIAECGEGGERRPPIRGEGPF